MRFDPEYFRKRSRENFEQAWHEGPGVLTPATVEQRYPRHRYHRAEPHPVFATIQRLRETYLALGFDEAEVPLIIEEQEIYRQFGPEASAVLDRVFYLGGLPRPNVGIARTQVDQIAGIIGHEVSPETEERLRETLHAYKKSTIDGDDLVHEMAVVLSADDAAVARILDDVFPEFKALAPESSRSTLRSHMTSGWFLTLRDLWDRVPLPLRLFSVDRCFRREQEEGPTRLMCYHSASCIIAGEDVTIEDGKAVSEALLSAFGYEDFRFSPDEKRSKYYMPETQTEVYARHPVHGWVEVATFGLYSPSALAEYGVAVPVMNLGLGVERLAMIAYGASDMRQLVYPQFFPVTVPDRALARAVHVREAPVTPAGILLAEAIRRTAAHHAAEPGPCSFLAWEGEIAGYALRVFVDEPESNTRLLGPACANEIFAYQGSVLGVPDTEKWADVRQNGVPTGMSHLDALSALAAARIEEAARCGEGTTVQVKMAKLPSDVNIQVDGFATRAITDAKKKIDLRGPLFMTVRSEVLPS